MSRNFELLEQIEQDSGSTTPPFTHDPTRIVAKGTSDTFEDRGPVGREEMQQLVHRVFISMDGSAPRTVVFCGVDTECAGSAVCASAGRILASRWSKIVCLIDANISSPRLSEIFAFDPSQQFTGSAGSVREQCMQVDRNLWLAGPGVLAGDRGTFPSTSELRRRLTELSKSFEYILIDAPGADIGADTVQLCQASEAVILLIEANSTRRLTARKVKEKLDAAGVRLLGTVLHNRSFPIPRKLYKRL
jgi:hypothetical protein